jgi:hypothetical protein
MTASNWIQRDELRESWIILLLGKAKDPQSENGGSKLRYWEYGIANGDQLVRTETEQIGSGDIDTEFELLAALLSQLGEYRYRETVIITRTEETVQTLRRRLAAVDDTGEISLRGLSNICIETLLERYFDQTLADQRLDQESIATPRRTAGTDERDVVSAGGVQNVWDRWQRIYRLLPATELAGEEL